MQELKILSLELESKILQLIEKNKELKRKNKEYKIKTYPEANKYLMTNNIAMISRGAISTINNSINDLIKESV